jgi:hypothetical protein
VVQQDATARGERTSSRVIAAALNDDEVPTAHGGAAAHTGGARVEA